MGSILYFLFLVILAYPVAKIIVYAKMENEERKKDINKNITENTNMPAFKEANRTYLVSNFITSYIKVETQIKSNLVIFEVIFFFIFLEKMNFLSVKVADSLKKQYLPMLRLQLQHENKLEYEKYKDKIEALINSRNIIYWKLMRKYSNKITKPFIQDAFRYLSELINYIEIFDDLSEAKNEPLSLQDWNEHAARFENLRVINDILNKNYKLIITFLDKKAIDNSLQ